MTSTETYEEQEVIPGEVADLLEKRSTIRAWIEGLEAREDDVRPEVYTRVEEDYRERLSRVEGELAGYRADLARSLEERRRVLEDTEERREERAALLEEVELRHEVGELTDEEWEESRGEHEAALEDLDARLGGIRTAVDRLEEVVEELSEIGERGAAAPEDAPAGVEEPDGAAAEHGEATATDGAEAVDHDAPEPVEHEAADEDGGAADERVARAEPVGDSGTSSGDAPPAEARSGGGADAEEEYEDELQFLESLSLDDPDALDTLSLSLDEEEDGEADESGGEGPDRPADGGGA